MTANNNHCEYGAQTQIVLASGSPRRRELFDRFWDRAEYTVCMPNFDEQTAMMNMPGAAPEKLAKMLTSGKISAVKSIVDNNRETLVVAADTIVVLDDQIMGKPGNQEDAAIMLRKLSDRKHQVITAVAVLICNKGNEQIVIETEKTDVYFDSLDDALINWYISTGEPMDKAGAYGIQGHGSALIKKINGCYYNVMGLPVNRLMNMLRAAAITSPDFSFISGLLPWS